MGGSVPKVPTLQNANLNAEMYDDEGRLQGSYTMGEDGKMVYRPRALTGQELYDRRLLTQGENSLLQRLGKTPQEYITASEEEARAGADLARGEMNRGYQATTRANMEASNSRGLAGSSAYRDVTNELNRSRTRTEGDIAMNYVAQRQAGIDAKTQRDYGLYGLYSDLKNQARQGSLATQSMLGSMAGQALSAQNMNNQNTMASYNASINRYQATEPWRNYIIPTATGLTQAYALYKK